MRRSGRDGGVFWTRSVRSRRERTRGEDLQMRDGLRFWRGGYDERGVPVVAARGRLR